MTVVHSASRRGALISSGIMIGAGLGGFIDGIVFHQILQWHSMLSNVRPPVDLVSMKYNMVWDGVFHVLAWLMTAVGIARLWRAGQRPDVPWSTSTFLGSLGMGWGLFNSTEGVVDHQILGIHHVHPGAQQLAWDMGFIASGVIFMAIGWAAIRAGRTDATPRGGLAESSPSA